MMSDLSTLYIDSPDCIRMRSGKYIDTVSPKPETIRVEDIAWALAHTYRFRGNTAGTRPITVAQHSCAVAHGMMNATEGSKVAGMVGLLHDAAEAILGDVPTPAKRHLYDYQRMELNLLRVIHEAIGVSAINQAIHQSLLKDRDTIELEYEWRSVVIRGTATPQTPKQAYASFLKMYKRLRDV